MPSSPKGLRDWLQDNTHLYPNGESIFKDASAAVTRYPTMQTNLALLPNGGKIVLSGELPISGGQITIPTDYSIVPPFVVDARGATRIPYLDNWNCCDLCGLIQSLVTLLSQSSLLPPPRAPPLLLRPQKCASCHIDRAECRVRQGESSCIRCLKKDKECSEDKFKHASHDRVAAPQRCASCRLAGGKLQCEVRIGDTSCTKCLANNTTCWIPSEDMIKEPGALCSGCKSSRRPCITNGDSCQRCLEKGLRCQARCASCRLADAREPPCEVRVGDTSCAKCLANNTTCWIPSEDMIKEPGASCSGCKSSRRPCITNGDSCQRCLEKGLRCQERCASCRLAGAREPPCEVRVGDTSCTKCLANNTTCWIPSEDMIKEPGASCSGCKSSRRPCIANGDSCQRCLEKSSYCSLSKGHEFWEKLMPVEPFFPLPHYPQIPRATKRATHDPILVPQAAEKATSAELPYVAASAISRILNRSENSTFVTEVRKLIFGGADPPVPPTVPVGSRIGMLDPVGLRLAHRFTVEMVKSNGDADVEGEDSEALQPPDEDADGKGEDDGDRDGD